MPEKQDYNEIGCKPNNCEEGIRMDIQKLVEEVLQKLNLDKSLVEKFKKDPIGTVKGLLASVNLNTEQLNAIVEAGKGKLNLEDAAGQATGFLAKLKRLFGGK